MWETACGSNKAAHLAHVAAAAALSAYKARLHAEQSVKDHQSLLKKPTSTVRKFWEIRIWTLEMTRRFRRSEGCDRVHVRIAQGEHDSVEIAAKNARSS